MTTQAKSSKYLKLQRGDGGGPEVFTTIAEVTNFKGLDENAPQIDVTSLDSAAMEYIGGLVDGSEITFDCNFVGRDAQQQGLRADLRAGTTRNFKLIANDHATNPTTVTFAAVVTGAPGISAAVNQALKSSCKLKVSGLSTWTYPP